jgi:hypothetical protein
MTIEDRLENMERELGRVKRHNRGLLGAILLLAGGLIVPGLFETTAIRAQSQKPGTVKEIRANNFIIEDEKGEVRATLGMTNDNPCLIISDQNRKMRVLLSLGQNGPGLVLLDGNGKSRVALIAPIKEIGPFLQLNDENGKIRAELELDKSGRGGLRLYDENREIRALLSVVQDGPILSLQDENGKNRAVVAVSKTISNLVLCGPDGKIIWRAIK